MMSWSSNPDTVSWRNGWLFLSCSTCLCTQCLATSTRGWDGWSARDIPLSCERSAAASYHAMHLEAVTSLSVKSLIPTAATRRVRLDENAKAGMDSSCSSGNSRTSVAASTGCWRSSLWTKPPSTCVRQAGREDSQTQTNLDRPVRLVTRASYMGRTKSAVGFAICAAVTGISISLRQGKSSASLSMGNEKELAILTAGSRLRRTNNLASSSCPAELANLLSKLSLESGRGSRVALDFQLCRC